VIYFIKLFLLVVGVFFVACAAVNTGQAFLEAFLGGFALGVYQYIQD